MTARLFLGAAIAWIALLALVAGPAAETGVARAVFRFGSYICHQQPDRSFHWDTAQWAVCARCLGLYAAASCGALAALAAQPSPVTRGRNFLLLCIAAMPTLVTWMGEHLLGWPLSNLARFIAALPLGAGAAWIIARTLQYTLPDARRA